MAAGYPGYSDLGEGGEVSSVFPYVSGSVPKCLNKVGPHRETLALTLATD